MVASRRRGENYQDSQDNEDPRDERWNRMHEFFVLRFRALKKIRWRLTVGGSSAGRALANRVTSRGNEREKFLDLVGRSVEQFDPCLHIDTYQRN